MIESRKDKGTKKIIHFKILSQKYNAPHIDNKNVDLNYSCVRRN